MPHQIDLLVGDKIREARLSRGLNQSELARKIGLSFQQVQKYEKAENRISISRLWEIAEVLNLPLSNFLAGLGKPEETSLSRESIRCAYRIEKIKDKKLRNRLALLIKSCAETQNQAKLK